MALPKVGIFWDYRGAGCPVPDHMTTSEAIARIQDFASTYGASTTFNVYFNHGPEPLYPYHDEHLAILTSLHHSGVVSVSNNGFNFGLATMLADIFSFLMDNGLSATAIAITADTSFSYGVSLLSSRKYNIVVAAPGGSEFPCQATQKFSWYSDVLRVTPNDPSGRPLPPSGRPLPPSGRPLPPSGRPLPPKRLSLSSITEVPPKYDLASEPTTELCATQTPSCVPSRSPPHLDPLVNIPLGPRVPKLNIQVETSDFDLVSNLDDSSDFSFWSDDISFSESLGPDSTPSRNPVVDMAAESPLSLQTTANSSRGTSFVTSHAITPRLAVIQPKPVIRPPPLPGKFAPLLWAIERNLCGGTKVSFGSLEKDIQVAFPEVLEVVGASSFNAYIDLACQVQVITRSGPKPKRFIKLHSRFSFLLRALAHFLLAGVSPVQRSVLEPYLKELSPTYLTSSNATTLGQYAQLACQAKLVKVSKEGVELVGSCFAPLGPAGNLNPRSVARANALPPPSSPSQFYHLIRVMVDLDEEQNRLDYHLIEERIRSLGYIPTLYTLVGVHSFDDYLRDANHANVVKIGTSNTGQWARLNPKFSPLLVGITAFISKGSDKVPRGELVSYIEKRFPKYLSLTSPASTGFAEYVQLAAAAKLVETTKKLVFLLGT